MSKYRASIKYTVTTWILWINANETITDRRKYIALKRDLACPNWAGKYKLWYVGGDGD